MKCKWCSKECKNKNALVQHEIRCHYNPNRLNNCGNHGATKGLKKRKRLALSKVNIDKKFHYLYKITNLVNGKFYYGIHSTNDLNDCYSGSGLRLNEAYKKYGYQNFKKEILEFFDTRLEASNKEHEIVNQELISSPLCYNMVEGGDIGICMAFKGKHHTKKTKEFLSKCRSLPDEKLKQKRRMMSKDGIMKSIRLEDIETYKKDGWALGGNGCKYQHTWNELREEQIKKKEERLKKEKEHSDQFWKEQHEREDNIVKAIQDNIDKVDIKSYGWLKRLSELTSYPQYTLRKKIHKKFPEILSKAYYTKRSSVETGIQA